MSYRFISTVICECSHDATSHSEIGNHGCYSTNGDGSLCLCQAFITPDSRKGFECAVEVRDLEPGKDVLR